MIVKLQLRPIKTNLRLRRLLPVILACLIVCPVAAAETPLRLATTTTTANSGLMDYLLPKFTAITAIPVHVIAVGTGRALRLAREGDVDIVLVHARAAEDRFVAQGYGVDRAEVMYNDFILVGPASDPAGIATSSSVGGALQKIQAGNHAFVSRGDESGTHQRELNLWRSTKATPQGRWYREIGQGMGKTLQIANEIDAYTLTDRGTWLAYRSRLEIELLFEGDAALFNPYGIIAVNPARHPEVNYSSASQLIQWITSTEAQQLIGEFKIEGQALFNPAMHGAG